MAHSMSASSKSNSLFLCFFFFFKFKSLFATINTKLHMYNYIILNYRVSGVSSKSKWRVETSRNLRAYPWRSPH